MSYEDLEEVRVMCAGKEQAAASEGKRGREGERSAREVDEPEQRALVGRMI